MKIEDVDLLQQHFSDQKEFIEDGYYRFAQIAENEFELSFSVPDSCGTSSYHPRIRFMIKGEEIIPLSLVDMVSNPVQHVFATEDQNGYLMEQLTLLKDKFYQVKKIQKS